jgi:hypothetical protein
VKKSQSSRIRILALSVVALLLLGAALILNHGSAVALSRTAVLSGGLAYLWQLFGMFMASVYAKHSLNIDLGQVSWEALPSPIFFTLAMCFSAKMGLNVAGAVGLAVFYGVGFLSNPAMGKRAGRILGQIRKFFPMLSKLGTEEKVA